MIAEQRQKRPAGMVFRDPPGGTRSERFVRWSVTTGTT